MTIIEESFISLFVPSEIMEHFEVTNLSEEGKVLIIDLYEKQDENHIPKSILREGKVVPNGYCNKLELQTYPAKGKEVYLRLYRRRWKVVGTKKSYSNTYEFTERGMKATKNFGAFLKAIGRE